MNITDTHLHVSFIRNQSPIHLVGDTAAQQTQRLSFGIAEFHSSLHIRLAEAKTPPLSDGDAMQCRIHLAIAPAVETMPCVIGRPDGYRCSAIPPSKRSLGSETSRTGDLANDLCSRELATTRQRQQCGSEASHEAADLVRKIIGTIVQRPTTCHQLARNVRYRARYASKTIVECT